VSIAAYRRTLTEEAENMINPSDFGTISGTASMLQASAPPLTARLREQERAVPHSTKLLPEPGTEAHAVIKARLMAAVLIEPSGCYTWTKYRNKHGYGAIFYREKKWLAHRLAYVILTGSNLPEGLVSDHLCRNRACINPAHIDWVTQRENYRRGMVPSAISLRTNRCQNGHEFRPETTFVDKRDGKRECMICRRERKARNRAS
jgi:hypothetical protein